MILTGQILLAFVAGILLNLTPCVLPAIPFKVHAIIKETGNHPSQRLLAAFSLLMGSLTFFLLLGMATVLLHLTWGILFQSKVFLALLTLFLLCASI